MQADVADFMKLRLKNVLSDADIRYDVVDAVFADIDDIYGVMLRAEAVNEAVKQDMDKTVQAFVRAGNIARKAEDSAKIDVSIFAEQVEKDLYAAYQTAQAEAEKAEAACDYAGAIAALAAMSPAIDAFFDGVMVMDKDAAVKANRVGLLKLVDAEIAKIADFSKIVLA